MKANLGIEKVDRALSVRLLFPKSWVQNPEIGPSWEMPQVVVAAG